MFYILRHTQRQGMHAKERRVRRSIRNIKLRTPPLPPTNSRTNHRYKLIKHALFTTPVANQQQLKLKRTWDSICKWGGFGPYKAPFGPRLVCTFCEVSTYFLFYKGPYRNAFLSFVDILNNELRFALNPAVLYTLLSPPHHEIG